MTTAVAARSGAWRALVLGQVLALAFLGACLAWVWRKIEYILPANLVTGPLGIEDALHSRLGWQLAAYLAALLLIHALLGLASFGLARLTRAAFPRSGTEARLTAGWFVLLVALVLLANTTLFPSSNFSAGGSWWQGRYLGLPPLAYAGIALASLVVLLLARAARQLPRRWQWAPVGISVAVGAVAVSILLWPSRIPALAAHGDSQAPHIVILGIDALRNDLNVPRGGPAVAPNIRAFIHAARRFEDATTPLARTYPSWTTILTGRHPVSTNARYNLMPRRLVREGETLAAALRARGYRAIYATDEVRYANFDATFGFDRLITPPIGAIDFLLGYAGDMPLVNLVAMTPAGGLLFPSNHANRAASVTYRQGDFTRRLEREIVIGGPAFIAIHLTTTHWPYSWAGRPTPTTPQAYRIAYGEAVRAVDAQFADVIRLLADKGVLENAIVVLLSDHGEALGADDDSIIRRTGTSRDIWDSLWGHGTSVLSPNQYQVLLAMRAYGRARLPGPDRNYDWPVSLEDLRPTLQELATGTAPAGVDGISLVPYMSEPSRADALAHRIRFTETGLNTQSILTGQYRPSGVVSEAAPFYELDPDSGWVQLRASRLPELIARKQRAALTSDALLAALPTASGAGVRYLRADRHGARQEPQEGERLIFADPESRRLRDALRARFGDELQPSAKLP